MNIPEGNDMESEPVVETEALDGSFLDISSEETVDTNNNANFECNTCKAKFCHLFSLRRHLNKHKDGPKFSCASCHQYFSSDDLLESHRTRCHSTRLLCAECGKDFKTKSSLENHLVQVHKHEKETTFKCPFEGCEKMFTRKQPYQFHLNKHTGVKPYDCHECGRKFISLYKKNQHEKICRGVAEIKCLICNTKFTDRASLKRHDNSKHKGLKHVCQCGKQYTQHSSLRRHQESKNH